MNLSTATTAELLAFYNEHANKPVARFSDRKTAERRVNELMAAIKFSKPSPKKAAALAAVTEPRASNPDRGAAIAASWQDKAVAERRAQRHAVRVQAPNGGEGNYKSVREAFMILALPLGQHIRFRGALKAAGRAEIQGHQFRLVERQG
jgi:hypothetical protein